MGKGTSNCMKHLILFYGRTGSGIIHNSIMSHYSLSPIGEGTTELHTDNFLDTTDTINSAHLDDWALKMHINTGISSKTTDDFGESSSHNANLLQYFVTKERIDNIYFSYREDIFDTYLSYIIAKSSNIWNSIEHHEYEKIATDGTLFGNVVADLKNTFDRWYDNQDKLFDRYDIIPVSYEDIIKTGQITSELTAVTKTVKQNSLEDKLALFEHPETLTKHFNSIKNYSWNNGRIRILGKRT